MENEVVIHVRAEDDTEPGFVAARAGAKKLGEDLERQLGQAGKRAGRALGEGIADGLKQHHQIIVQRARSIGDDVEDVMGRAGRAAGIELGQGVQDGFGAHRPDIDAAAADLGASIETQMSESGRRAGQSLADGIAEGMRSGAKRGGGGGGDIIPDALGKGVKAGAKVGQGVLQGMASALESGVQNEKLMAALVAVGLAASPMLGGVLAAAVVGGAGGLGIVGGLLAASMDPRVKGAAAAIKDTIQDDLKEAVKPFVPSVVDAIGRTKEAFQTVLPSIEGIFEKAGPLMDPLWDGILAGVARLVTAIDETMGEAQPVFDALGRLADATGEQLAEVFTDLADNSSDAAQSVDLLSGTFGLLLDVAVPIIEVLTTIGAFFDDTVTGAQMTGEAIVTFVEDLLGLQDATEEVSLKNAVWHDSASDAAEGVYDQVEAVRQLEAEMKKQTDPLLNVLDLQARLKTAQDKYNKAVKENGEESGKARKALVDLGKAGFDLTGAMSDAASEGFNGSLTPAMRNMLKQAGLSAGQIDKLEKELIAAWKASDKWAGQYTAHYVTRYSTVGKKTGNFGSGGDYSGVGGLAHGGVAGAANGSMSSGLTMVGESGPELVSLPAGTQVHSNADTRRHLGADGPTGMLGRGGGQQAFAGRVTFDPAGASKLIRAIMETLRMEIKYEGGNVQTVLGVN